jgi:hypothetical protein
MFKRLLPDALKRKLALRPLRQAISRLVAAQNAPEEAQRRTLTEILSQNRATEFGHTHGFAKITNLKDFKARVPVRSYRELSPFIERQAAEQRDVLVRGPIAGMASFDIWSEAQQLPISQPGLGHWQWLEQLLEHAAINASLSTLSGSWLHLLPRDVAAARLLGEKRAGLVNLRRQQLAPLPTEVYEIDDFETRYYYLLRLALQRPTSVMRAESPGTLTFWARQLDAQHERLLDHLEHGVVDKNGIDERIAMHLPSELPADPERANTLRELRKTHGRLDPPMVWPELCLLFCPLSGAAENAAQRLSDRFGDVILLDSAPLSPLRLTLPAGFGEGGQLITDGQIIEFLPRGELSLLETLRSDQLELGKRYRPVITNHSGCYRFLLDDVYEVIDGNESAPKLARVARAETRLPLGHGSLEERAVKSALLAAFREADVVVTGFSSWLDQLPEPTPDAEPKPGFFGRLFGKSTPQKLPRVEGQRQLVLAVEPGQALEPQQAHKLLVAADRFLQNESSAYAAVRQPYHVVPQLWLLRRGSFARLTERRVANGRPYAHAPMASLLRGPDESLLSLADERVVL